MSSRVSGPNIPFYDLSFAAGSDGGYMYHRGVCRGIIIQPIRGCDPKQPIGRAFCKGCSHLVGKKAWRLLELPLRGGEIVTRSYGPARTRRGPDKYWRMFLRESSVDQPCDPEPPICGPAPPIPSEEVTPLEKIQPASDYLAVSLLEGVVDRGIVDYPLKKPVSVRALADAEHRIAIVKGNISMSIPRGNLTMDDLVDLNKTLERMPDDWASIRRIEKLVSSVRRKRAKKERVTASVNEELAKLNAISATLNDMSSKWAAKKTGRTSANKEKMYSGGLRKPAVKRKAVRIGGTPRRRW